MIENMNEMDGPKVLDLEEFLAIQELSSPVSDFLTDKMKDNGLLKTNQGESKFKIEAKAEIDKPRLFVDLDGTEAHFNNTIESLEVLHEEGYYRHLEPHQNVVDAVNNLIDKYPGQVYILSATLNSPYAAKDKMEWVNEFNPKLPLDHLILCPYGQPKHDYVPGGIYSTDVLLDDYTSNLKVWEDAGGQGVKLINNINHTRRSWAGPTISYNASSEDILNKLEDITFSNKVLLYHGSPSLFETFDVEKIGDNVGTEKGYGFYFTKNQTEAISYSQEDGILYEVKLTPDRELMHEKLSITKEELLTIFERLPKEMQLDILSNYGEVELEGIIGIQDKCLNSLLEYSKSDVELIGDLIHQTNDKREILSAFTEEGYTHSVGTDNTYVVIAAKAIEIQRTCQINNMGLKKDIPFSTDGPVLSVNVNYQSDDFYSIKKSVKELNQIFTEILSNPEKKTEIRISLNKDGTDVLKNEKISYQDLLEHQDAVKDNKENSLFEILKDKAKNNILLHQNQNKALEKYSALDELFKKIEMMIVEEVVVIGPSL